MSFDGSNYFTVSQEFLKVNKLYYGFLRQMFINRFILDAVRKLE